MAAPRFKITIWRHDAGVCNVAVAGFNSFGHPYRSFEPVIQLADVKRVVQAHVDWAEKDEYNWGSIARTKGKLTDEMKPGEYTRKERAS